MNRDIRHDESGQRFVLETEHGKATLEYSKIDDETLDYESTFVPEEDREQGIGEDLVLHAMDWARENGFHVVPSCPFTRSVLEEHPEYQDAIAAGR